MNKILSILVVILFLLPFIVLAQTGTYSPSTTIKVTEEDGSPSINAKTLKFPNGSVTNNGGNSVSITTSGANSSGYYLVTQSTNAPTNALNLGALSSGILYCTVAGNICTPSIVTSANLLVGFGNVTANYVAAGPSTGAATTPTFRALVAADMPTDLSTIAAGGAANCLWGEKSDSSGVECKSTIQLQMDDSAAQFKSATENKGYLKNLLSGSTDGKILTFSFLHTDDKTVYMPDPTTGDYVTLGSAAIRLNTGGATARVITVPDAASTMARIDAGQTFTGVNIFTAPTFTTSITPTAAGASTIGTAALEWGNLYLTDSVVIYGQADQSNSITSSATGWTFAKPITTTQAATADYVHLRPGSGATNPTYYRGWGGPTQPVTGATEYTFPDADPTVGQVMLFGAVSSNKSQVTWGTPATLTGTETLTNKTLTAPLSTLPRVDGSAAISPLSAAQVSGTVIRNTGQALADVNHTLPQAAAGYNFIAFVGTTLAATNYWRFTADASPQDYMCLDGTCGKTYVSVDTPTMGDTLTCYTEQQSSTGLKNEADLAVGTSAATAVKNTAAIEFDIAGTGYSKAVAETAPGNDVIPQGKFGGVGFEIGVDGTIHAMEAADNATGYDTAALALAAAQAVALTDANHTRIGYVTASKSDGDFTFGTTELSAANTTVAYTDVTVYTPPFGWVCITGKGTWTTD